ncbi:hypothetical protein SO694_00007119 [Aureococcus anophagefferens]|uniref:Uncharacterized protein n=1 Tax=Aureococcus anophagefferens TaxID=44056 RepID=A0ABR1GB32_AURAN
MPLATFLAVAVARDADADPDAAAVARTVPGFDDADARRRLSPASSAPVWKSNLQPDFNRRRVEGVDPLLPRARERRRRAGRTRRGDAVARFDDETTCYLVDELHDDLDVFFPGPDAADARAAFDAKKDRYAADALAAVVRDITGTS